MTEHRETTRYATPSLRRSQYNEHRWYVLAQPWDDWIGFIEHHPSGWTATAKVKNLYAGLWPTKQAAAEVLVRQAGYEVGEA